MPFGFGGSGGAAAAAFGIDALFRQDFVALFGDGLLSEDGYDPLLDSATYDVSQGAQPYVRDDAYTGGVLSGPSAAGTGYLFNANGKPSVAGQRYIANPRNQPWAVGSLSAIAAAPGATTFIWLAALTTNVNDSVGFTIDGTISTTVAQLVVDGTVSGTGVSTTACNAVGTIGSGILIGSANFLRMLIGFDPNTGLCKLGVNGVLAASVSPGTKMPAAPMSPALIASHTAASIHRVQGLWWGYGL